MASASELIDQLKKECRRRGVTYAMLGEHLELSESSIKRLFSEQDMSLKRMEAICSLIDTDMTQLCAQAEHGRQQLTVLTREQEQRLIDDEQLLLLAVHLMVGWRVPQILEVFDLKAHQVQQHLAELDRMQIIELLPENRTRQRLSPHFQWIPGGPIQRFFEQSVQGNFFDSDFTGPGELRLMLNGWMSIEHIEAFHKALHRLAREFEDHKKEDKHTTAENKRGTSLVVAIRPWALDIFERYRR